MQEYIVEFGSQLNLENKYIHERVVRCRVCKYHEYMTVSYLDKPLSVCYSEQWLGAEGDNPIVDSNGFCAWGERK